MRYEMTEDEVRDFARTTLDLKPTESAQAGVGQLTSFNKLGFAGIKDRPDGWYLPNETHFPALILEVKGSNVKFGDKERAELIKNIKITLTKYDHVVGILFNGYEIEVYKDLAQANVANDLKAKDETDDEYSEDAVSQDLVFLLEAKLLGKIDLHLWHRLA